MAAATRLEKPAEFIQADGVYPLSTISKTLGLGKWAMRSARRRGLKVRKIGRRAFVLGSDVIDFVREQEAVAVAGH